MNGHAGMPGADRPGTTYSEWMARTPPGLRNNRLALAPPDPESLASARALVGEVEGANLVKLHRFSGKVTYLVSPDLETAEEPRVSLRVKVELPRLDVRVFDYSGWPELPGLYAGGR